MITEPPPSGSCGEITTEPPLPGSCGDAAAAGAARTGVVRAVAPNRRDFSETMMLTWSIELVRAIRCRLGLGLREQGERVGRKRWRGEESENNI